MGTIRCQEPPAAGMGLSPSLGCLSRPHNVLLRDLVTLAPFCIPVLLLPPSSLCLYIPLYLILAQLSLTNTG